MDTTFAETLVTLMPDAVVYADRDGTIRYWNAGAARIFGFAEDEAMGRSLDLIIPEGLRTRHWDGYRETMRTARTRYGDGQTLSVPALTKDGRRISVAFTIVPFPDDAGGLRGIAAIMRDCTAQFEEIRALRKEIAGLKDPRSTP
jgi:PAS domain S-box-containing protein